MSEQLINVVADYEYDKKLYKVCKRDLHIQLQFADWVMREAAGALERLGRHVSPEFQDAQLRIFNSKVAGKQFRWGSEDVVNAAWSEEGRRHMLWLKIERGRAKGGEPIQREALDKIADAEDKTKWQELMDILYQQDMPDFFKDTVLPERERARKEKEQSQDQPDQSGQDAA